MDRNDDEFLPSLQNVAETFGYPTRAYSGRGMNGKECLGIELDAGVTPFILIANLIKTARSLDSGHSSEDDRDVQDDAMGELTDALPTLRTDSLGHGTIVYFPGIEYVEEG